MTTDASSSPSPSQETRTYEEAAREAEAPPGGVSPGPLRRGSVLGRYVVVDELGAGGMGVVYAAFDPELDRKVAIKLLHPERVADERRSEARTRILREAQALAKLRHPNVLTVFDVNTRGDEVFLATELVEGESLRAWLRQGRSRREILAAFRQAGEGLAAAHRAGVVHRDFKPANVMVGEDGRVLVVDFGLARAESAEEDVSASSDSVAAAGPAPSPGALHQPLTRTGHQPGTPAYMAPERLSGGEPVRATTDQFSFCVALWEALYGQLPFPASQGGLVFDGTVPRAPERKRIPGRIHRLLLRGLAIDPGARFASMDDLLVELSDEPRAGRIRRLAAAFVAAAGVLGVGWLLGPERGLCTGGEAKLREVWDAERRQEMRRAFESTGQPIAEASWQSTAAALDGYGERWIATYRQTCEATHVRGEQSARLLDVRMGCLEQRRRELAALADAFAEADTEVVRHAVEAAYRLTPPVACADAAAPADLSASLGNDRRGLADEIRNRLAQAEASRFIGRYAASLEVGEAAVVRARELDDWGLVAESLLAVGKTKDSQGDADGAESALVDAILAAKVARHDRVAAEAFIQLVRVAGSLRREPARAERFAGQATAELEQLGRPPVLTARLLAHTAFIHYTQAEYPEADRNYRRALELIRREPGGDTPQAAEILARLGQLSSATGELRAAVPLFEEALAIDERTLGRDHLEVARVLLVFGGTLKVMAEHDRALEMRKRALDIAQRTLGSHYLVANYLTDLGSVYLDMGRPSEALDLYEKALEMADATMGRDHPSYAVILTNIGLARLHLDRPAEALEPLRRAREMKRDALGGDHPDFAFSTLALADALGEAGDIRGALAHYRQAAEVFEQALGRDHYLTADGYLGIGLASIDLGRPAEAVAALEAALEIREAVEEDPRPLAATRFALARALVLAGGERRRARELAQAAREGFREAGERSRKELEEVDGWLIENPPADVE